MQTIFFLNKCNIVLSTVNKKVKNKKQRGKIKVWHFDFHLTCHTIIYLFIFLSRFAIVVQPFNNLTLPLSKNNNNASGEVSLIVYYFNLYLDFLFLVRWIGFIRLGVHKLFEGVHNFFKEYNIYIKKNLSFDFKKSVHTLTWTWLHPCLGSPSWF